MEIDILSYGKQNRKKILRFLYMLLFVIGVGSMTGGPWSSNPLYVTYNAPIWLYIITSIICFILLILIFEYIFSDIPKIGKITFETNRVKIIKNKNTRYLSLKEIQNIQITRNYLKDESTSSKKIIIETNNDSIIFDVRLSDIDESELLKIISK